MLILLPPSEGKFAPARGKPVHPETWPVPLGAAREEMLASLMRLSQGDPDTAARVLGLGVSQWDEIERNAFLLAAPAARADRVYTGVLYEALSFDTLSNSAKRRAANRVLIMSSLFGVVAPTEHIPAYRLSGGVTLPDLGSVAGFWRRHLDPVLRERLGSGLLVDLRSTTYAGFWKPADDIPRVTVRVLQERDGKRSVVSHFNKATKGRLVRALLEDGRDPRSPRGFAELLTDLGWRVERDGSAVDVIVTEV